MAEQFVINRVSNHCRFYGSVQDISLIKNHVHRIAKERLPTMIERLVSQYLASKFSSDGVYRINKLRLNLVINKEQLVSGLMGERFAEDFMSALIVQFDQKDFNFFQYYENESNFIACLICDLLDGTAWNKWQYEEFQALSYLDNSEAIVQLFVSRPKQLSALVCAIEQGAKLNKLLNEIDDRQINYLIENWSETDFNSLLDFTNISSIKELSALIGKTNNKFGHLDNYDSIEKKTLGLLFYFLNELYPANDNLYNLIVISAHLSLVSLYRTELVSLLESSNDNGNHQSNFVDELKSPKRVWVGNLIQRLEQESQVKAYVEQLISFWQKNEIAKNEPTIHQNQKVQEKENSSNSRLVGNNLSPNFKSQPDSIAHYARLSNAGIAFLLPSILQLQLLDCFPRSTILKAINYALYETEYHTDTEWVKPILSEQCIASNLSEGLPPRWHHGLHFEVKKAIEKLTGIEQLAKLLLAHFAARLSGLQLSSADYLRKQFLFQAGSLRKTEKEIRVLIDSVPLRIILSMSGFTNWRGKLNGNEQEIVIEVLE